MGAGIGKHSSSGSSSPSPYNLSRRRRPDSTDSANAFTKEYSQYWSSTSSTRKTSNSASTNAFQQSSPRRTSNTTSNDFWTAGTESFPKSPNAFSSPFGQNAFKSSSVRSSSSVCPDSPLLLATGQALKREPPKSYIPRRVF